MTYTIAWTDNALSSLADSISYLTQRNAPAAQGVLDRIEARLDALKTPPRTGKPYPKAADPNLRQVVVVPYVIVYRVIDSSQQVQILMVRHSRQQMPSEDEIE